jgi:hypothetical protein
MGPSVLSVEQLEEPELPLTSVQRNSATCFSLDSSGDIKARLQMRLTLEALNEKGDSMMKRSTVLLAGRFSLALAICGAMQPLSGGGQSGKVVDASQPDTAGSATFADSLGVDRVFVAVLEYLKKHGYTIDSADKNVGQIITAMDIKGGFTQTGTTVQVTLIRDSDTQTTVRVAVKTQRRVKGAREHPWRDIKIDPKESSRIAEELKAALKTV